ncbi:B-cell receptor CD22-like [Carassius carassius]|uniref:B-cell receptor CD22-like n=1 Tax=Carassius carassius TaxID=217509 RepID=UPI0028685A98|nr:B-cell receptor CD22-like [Carassius carassius]
MTAADLISFNTIYLTLMSVRMAPRLPLIFLLMIHGVSSADWGVSYSHSRICALKNSSVIMSCTYTYPTGYKIEKVFWTNSYSFPDPPDLFMDPEYSQRLQYLGDKQQNCTIRLSHVTQKDQHMYYFRFITDKPDGKWIGHPGVTLTVTDPPENPVIFISPPEIVEGDSVTLNCSSDSNPPAEISWFQGRTFVGSGRIYSISKISSDHSEEYKCRSINEHGEKYSDAVTLNIMYPPRNVSVSINGSGVIVEGDSVTLICSSDSNPPAEISWFKENQNSSFGYGQSFSAPQGGRFYCEAHNQHGSQRSDAVTVTVKGRLVILYISAGVVCGAAVIITILLIWWVKKRNKTQVNHSGPHHDRHKTCNDELNEPVYANEMAAQGGPDICKPELNSPVYENIPKRM